jgi:hypothetical protein
MDATRKAIRELAAQVVSGHLPPGEGARRIAAQAAALEDPAGFEVFEDLARGGSDERILEEVSLLLADTA